jgi:DNA-binding PadR family transcriptional regulator
VSQHRLLLLGLLQVEAQHGYQLTEAMEGHLSRIADLKKATIYYELKRLEAEGLIAARTEQTEGRPPRRVFAVTESGQTAFASLLRESLREPELPICGSDSALIFLDWLPPAEAAALLTERLAGLKERREALSGTPSHGEGSAVDLVLAHARARADLEIRFTEELLALQSARPEEAMHR